MLAQSCTPATAGTFIIEAADPRSPAAVRLIEALTVELVARYDGEDDGTGNFRPEDVLVAGAAFVVGRIGDSAVACGAFRPLEPGVAELKRIYVAAEHRGRGLAGRLLAELERRAVAAGYAMLRLETGTRQQESMRLYERCGYRQIPNFGPYALSRWSVCYEKAIGEQPVST